jgi:hypothetical protein
MTLESILILCLYAFVLLGVFLGPKGPLATFQTSGPRLGAIVERNIATGEGFHVLGNGIIIDFVAPPGNGN